MSAPAPAVAGLGGFDPAGPLPAGFPFGRGSVIRQVFAEPACAFLLQRALVMEVAHPKVGAGVADHSSFARRPLSRAFTTADAGLRVVFGNAREATEAVRQIYRFHDHVNGQLPEGAGPWPGASPYTAHDASLLLWVWATLVDTGEVAFTRWVRPWAEGEADRYYSDMATFARFFGISDDLVPPDRAAFACYLEHMLDSGLLGGTATSQAMASQILRFRSWNVPAPFVRPLRVLSIATLDARLRGRLGLDLNRGDDRLARRLDAVLRDHYHRLPQLRTRAPCTYVLLRRHTVGLAQRIRGDTSTEHDRWPKGPAVQPRPTGGARPETASR